MQLLRTSACPDVVTDATEYLRSRNLWPLPTVCAWRAHVGVNYYRPLDGKAFENVGRFPALVAAVRDIDGDLVTAHVTYLKDGKKAPVAPPRKTLTPMTGREGCAARLMPLAGEVLGIAEGIETAIAASVLHDDVPTWAALSTALLGRFIPPPEVRRLLVFADRDVAGLKAAWHLRDHLGERCAFELHLPPAQFGDWCDMLEARAR
jgi:putative DNA primase/helicase